MVVMDVVDEIVHVSLIRLGAVCPHTSRNLRRCWVASLGVVWV